MKPKEKLESKTKIYPKAFFNQTKFKKIVNKIPKTISEILTCTNHMHLKRLESSNTRLIRSVDIFLSSSPKICLLKKQLPNFIIIKNN